MPKKANKETPEQQAERFRKAVQAMVDAGELNPTEADAQFEQVMSGVVRLRQQWFAAEEDREYPD